MKNLIREGQLVAMIGWDSPGEVQFAIAIEKRRNGDWNTKIGDAETISAYVPESDMLPLKVLLLEDVRDLTPNQAVKKHKDEILAILLKGIKEETAKFGIIQKEIEKQLLILETSMICRLKPS